MNICVDGDNFFHVGWMTCFLGLPRHHPSQNILRPEEVSAFQDGWDTCDETADPEKDLLVMAMLKMKEKGQVTVCWVDEANNELEIT